MKRKPLLILLFLLLTSYYNVSSAQDLHGYSMAIANKLSDDSFVVTSRGFLSDSESMYCIHMDTPEFYDEELTRFTISMLLSGYSDVKRVTPWESSYTGSECTYRIGDTELSISIYDRGTDLDGLPKGCSVSIYESINPDWVKKKSSSKRKSTTSKKKTSKRKR